MTSGQPGQDQPITLDSMRRDIARILHEDPQDVPLDESLVDFGLDSIRAMALAARWRDAGALVEFSDMAGNPVLSHWWQLVQQALAARSAG